MGGKRTLPGSKLTTQDIDFYPLRARVSNMSDQPDSSRRDKIMEAVFGERLTGDNLLRHKAARPSKKIHYALQLVRLILITFLGASLINGESRMPLIGPWLTESAWGIYAAVGGCWIILAFSEWYYERRKKTLQL